MSIPTGYEKLAVIGIAWKNEYVQGTAYKTMNAVYYNGSTYVALRDNPTGPPAADGANWQYLAKGFEQQLLSAITALDTSGMLGEAGATVGGQALMDAIADKVMTKLVERSAIVQTESTDATTVPSSPYVKTKFDQLNSDLAPQLIGSTTSADGTISSANFSKYRFLIVRIGAGGWSRTEFFINQSYIGAFYALDNTADQKIRLDYDGTKIKLSGYSGGSFNICEAYGFVLK